MDRTREFVANIPFFTLVLLAVNIAIHIFVFLFSVDISPFTFNPYQVVYGGEYYRIFTSAFLHGGILHIGMNMMSLITLGSLLEPTYGSLRFFWITWSTIFLTALNYVFFAWLSTIIMSNPSYMFSNSIGYSGVLFAYTAIEAFHASSPYRSVFGLFSVPTKIYPVILLAVIQFILPNISFFGHLGGLCAGLMLISSFAEWCVLPSQAAFEYMETSLCCSLCRRQSSFRLLTNVSLLHSMLEIRMSSSSSNIFSSVISCISPVWTVLSTIFTMLGQFLYTICFIIGIPVDSIVQRSQTCYSQTIGRCINAFQSGIRRMSNHTTSESDIENPPSSSPRLNALPTTISSTPLLPTNDHRNSLATNTSTGTSSFYANYGLGGAMGSGHATGGIGNGGRGYELVSQQAPDSHFTNAPIHNMKNVAAEEKSTMIEVTEDHHEDATKNRSLPQQQSQSVSMPANGGSNTGTSSQQYYHRSKQTSRLLNPELYGNSGNSKK